MMQDTNPDTLQTRLYLGENLVRYEIAALASAHESERLLPAHGEWLEE